MERGAEAQSFQPAGYGPHPLPSTHHKPSTCAHFPLQKSAGLIKSLQLRNPTTWSPGNTAAQQRQEPLRAENITDTIQESIRF